MGSRRWRCRRWDMPWFSPGVEARCRNFAIMYGTKLRQIGSDSSFRRQPYRSPPSHRLHRIDCSSNSIILPTGCEWELTAMAQTILSALAPIIFTLLLGFVAAWRHDFGPKEASVLNRMVLLYAVPLALFVGTVGTSRTDLVQDIAFVVAIFVAIVGFYVLVFVLFNFVFRFSLSESVLAALAASSPAVPFMGPAILGDLFGKASAVAIAIAALIINLVVVPITILGLALGGTIGTTAPTAASHSAFAKKLLETVKEPIVWAPVLAFVLVLCNVRVPSIVDHGLSLLGQASGGVALFASGIMLAAYKIEIDLTALSLALLKNIVQPALVLVGLLSLGYGAPIVPEAVLTTAIPVMPIVIVLAVQYHVQEARASSALFFSVFGSMFTIGIFIALTH